MFDFRWDASKAPEGQKFNRVDLLVEDSSGRKIIIEIQNQREADIPPKFTRILDIIINTIRQRGYY